MKNKIFRKAAGAALMSLALTAQLAVPVFAGPTFLPDVTKEMCEPEYWLDEYADLELADQNLVKELNEKFLVTDGLNMKDLTKEPEVFDGAVLNRNIWRASMSENAAYLDGSYYDSDGEEISGAFMLETLMNIENPDAQKEQELLYGICVNRSNLRQLPTDRIVTDAVGDNDFDYMQLSALRVNEPVLVRSVSTDKAWYYVDSTALSGWAHAEDIAICADKKEWESAWKIPEEKLLVVTGGKFFLEQSNTSPELSGRMLTMGTALELADPEDYTELISNRAVYHNYVVWMPVRKEDGSYEKELALISEHQPVHEGYLPLTDRNILETAFSMLGDAYGWGGMLDSNDCSGYLQDIYSCFGLKLPRNTTWQAAMPVYKFDTREMSTEEKKEILDMLPAGSLLYFNGHGMMYLGSENGKYYVISSFSSMMDADGVTRRRVRSVSVNTLDTLRANGHAWIEDIHTMLIPYMDEVYVTEEPAEGETDAADTPEDDVLHADLNVEEAAADITEDTGAEELLSAEGTAADTEAETETEEAVPEEEAAETDGMTDTKNQNGIWFRNPGTRQRRFIPHSSK